MLPINRSALTRSYVAFLKQERYQPAYDYTILSETFPHDLSSTGDFDVTNDKGSVTASSAGSLGRSVITGAPNTHESSLSNSSSDRSGCGGGADSKAFSELNPRLGVDKGYLGEEASKLVAICKQLPGRCNPVIIESSTPSSSPAIVGKGNTVDESVIASAAPQLSAVADVNVSYLVASHILLFVFNTFNLYAFVIGAT